MSLVKSASCFLIPMADFDSSLTARYQGVFHLSFEL